MALHDVKLSGIAYFGEIRAMDELVMGSRAGQAGLFWGAAAAPPTALCCHVGVAKTKPDAGQLDALPCLLHMHCRAARKVGRQGRALLQGEGQACAAAPSHAMFPNARCCCELGCLWAYHLGFTVTAALLLTKRKAGGPLDKVCEGVCDEPPKLVSARLARALTCNGHLSNTLQ